MKLTALFISALGMALISTTSLAQRAGRFSLEGSVIASGGGTGREGRFTLEGTIGQPLVASGRARRYQLESGFWTSVTIRQSPGAPTLRITPLQGGWVKLSWPAIATEFHLEECSDLAAESWQDAQLEAVVEGAEFSVTVPSKGIVRCYRLKR